MLVAPKFELQSPHQAPPPVSVLSAECACAHRQGAAVVVDGRADHGGVTDDRAVDHRADSGVDDATSVTAATVLPVIVLWLTVSLGSAGADQATAAVGGLVPRDSAVGDTHRGAVVALDPTPEGRLGVVGNHAVGDGQGAVVEDAGTKTGSELPVLFEIVVSLTVSVPSLSIPPPLSLFPSSIVSPEIVTRNKNPSLTAKTEWRCCRSPPTWKLRAHQSSDCSTRRSDRWSPL